MKKALLVILSVIGALLCAFATIMAFDQHLNVWAPTATILGTLLIFMPQTCIWRDKEHGATVTAAAIIGFSIVLGAIILAIFGVINPM